jgi:hypothetical protein
MAIEIFLTRVARAEEARTPRVALAVAECDDRVFRIVVPDS